MDDKEHTEHVLSLPTWLDDMDEMYNAHMDEMYNAQMVAPERKCAVRDCHNTTHEGSFVGSLCSPCYEYLSTGKGEHSRAYLFMQEELTKRLTEMEDQLQTVQRLSKTLQRASERVASWPKWKRDIAFARAKDPGLVMWPGTDIEKYQRNMEIAGLRADSEALRWFAAHPDAVLRKGSLWYYQTADGVWRETELLVTAIVVARDTAERKAEERQIK